MELQTGGLKGRQVFIISGLKGRQVFIISGLKSGLFWRVKSFFIIRQVTVLEKVQIWSVEGKTVVTIVQYRLYMK